MSRPLVTRPRSRRAPARLLVLVVLLSGSSLTLPGAPARADDPLRSDVSASGSVFLPTPPTRVMDTRPEQPRAAGTYDTGAVLEGTARTLTLPDVPAGATAAVLTVTAVSPTTATYVSACPGGLAVAPTTPGACGSSSTLNLVGAPRANSTTVALGGPGGDQVEFYNAVGAVQVVADLAGYYVDRSSPRAAPGGARFHAAPVRRALDTRPGLAAPAGSAASGPVSGGTSRVVTLLGVPVGAVAVALNVTGVQSSAGTFLSVCPGGLPLVPTGPGACGTSSNLNLGAETVATGVTVSLGGPHRDQVQVYNAVGSTHAVADVAGFYVDESVRGAPGGGALFKPTVPTRVTDTRPGTVAGSLIRGKGPLTGGSLRAALDVEGPSGGVTAVVNLTATGSTAPTFVSVCLSGQEQGCRSTSVLNPLGRDIANQVLVPAFPSYEGAGLLYNAVGSTHLVVDLLGWFVEDRWLPGTPMQVARWGHAAAALQDGRLLVVGGVGPVNRVTRSAALFDPTTATWSAAPSTSMTHGSATLATALPDGRVLVQDSESETSLDQPEVYDPVGLTWTPTYPLAVTMDSAQAVALGGRVLVIGTHSGGLAAQAYDPVADVWSALPAPAPAALPGPFALVALNDGRALLLVPSGPSSALLAQVWDPATGSWSATSSPRALKSAGTATLMHDGRVLVTSPGQDRGAELYLPSTGTWSTTGPMAHARERAVAVALQDGRVLLLGGDANHGDRTSEAYAPTTGTWHGTTPVLGNYYRNSATVLRNGDVVRAGGLGSDGSGSGTEATEVFGPGRRP